MLGSSPTIDWPAIALTVRLASISIAILLLVGTPVAWWLARTSSRLAHVVGTTLALPLVLPPTVLGFYLLVLFGADGPFTGLAFTFEGLVAGSVLFSLPFVVQPLRAAFERLDPTILEAAATLGAGPVDRFIGVVVPASWPAFLTATTLAFAHVVGEFGVVLMIGGNIPEETRVVSIAIYDAVEQGETSSAHAMSIVLLVFSFAALFLVNVVGRRAEVLR